MGLEEEYPKTCRRRTARIRKLLETAQGLGPKECADLAISLNQMADKARDLDEIMDRLLNEEHTPAEIGDLLIAFELTTEQLRGHSDVIDGKLYEIGDHLHAITPATD
jgi:predicted  nucleic acid-binding Zn-ribbon protein